MLFYLPWWLKWYSIGLEIRHSERISGFESLSRRLSSCLPMERMSDYESDAAGSIPVRKIYGIVAKRLRRPAATRKVRVRVSLMPLYADI